MKKFVLILIMLGSFFILFALAIQSYTVKKDTSDKMKALRDAKAKKRKERNEIEQASDDLINDMEIEPEQELKKVI